MKKIIFSWFSIFVFATIVLSGVTHAQPIKTDEKLKPKTLKIPAKKGVADLVVKNVNITPPVPRAGKDMVKIKVTV